MKWEGEMRRYLWILLCTPWLAEATEPQYTTSCRIQNGTAHGYVHNTGSSFEIDGYVWFYFFDKDGDLADKENEYEYEYVSGGGTEEVESTSAPSDATTCTFDISGAIKGASPSPPLTYQTSCEIRGGTAYGKVHNFGDAFVIDGYVWFYFFDKDGDVIDEEDEYEYEYVSSGSEEIEHTSAPSGAVSCSFDIRGAIKP